MSGNLSKGPIQVVGNDVLSLNDVFRQIQDRLDALLGLSGEVSVFDTVKVSENIDSTVSTSQGKDYVKIVDSNGVLLHGMGNV